MKDSERVKFYGLVSDVMSYYGKDASEFTLALFWDACRSFEFEQIAAAMNAHAKDPELGRFAPKVADLVRVLQGTSTDRSLLAWGRVYEAMSDVGAYQDVDFGDAAIHACIMDLGGWPKVCRTEQKDLSYLQHRFCESYKAYAARGAGDAPLALRGDRSPDDIYAKRGLPPPQAVKLLPKHRTAIACT